MKKEIVPFDEEGDSAMNRLTRLDDAGVIPSWRIATRIADIRDES
jgi:hypothetical protein